MKSFKLYNFIVLAIILTYSQATFAQNESDKAGIFFISFNMDEDLMNDITVTVNDRAFLNSFSEAPIFPEAIIDSIKILFEDVTEKVLGTPSSCVYKTNKKGKQVVTLGMNGDLEGMPVDLLKSARKQHKDLDYFVRININITGRGGSWTVNPRDVKFKLRPTVTMRMTQYDKAGKTLFSERLKVKEFGKLKSRKITSSDDRISVRKSEILYPEDVYEMLLAVTREFIINYQL